MITLSNFLFFFLFLSGRSKDFPFHSFFTLHKFIPKCQRGAQSELCQKRGGRGGGVHFIFHDFFSLNRSLENVCACQQRWGSWLFAAPLESLNHSRIKTREKKKYMKEKNTGKKDVKRNKNSEQIDVRWREEEICLLFYCLCGMLYKRPIFFTE